MRKASSESNSLSLLHGLGKMGEHDCPDILQLGFQQGDHPCPKSLGHVMDTVYDIGLRRLQEHTASGGQSISAFDNMCDACGQGAQRIGKYDTETAATAAFTAMPKAGYIEKGSSQVPTTLYKETVMSGPAHFLSKTENLNQS